MRPLYRTPQIIWYIITGVIEILFFFRLFLKLLGANPQTGFTQFIDGATWRFASPFLYVFLVTPVEGNVFEWSTLLAMAVYGLIAWFIVKAIVMAKPVTTEEAKAELPKQEKISSARQFDRSAV